MLCLVHYVPSAFLKVPAALDPQSNVYLLKIHGKNISTQQLLLFICTDIYIYRRSCDFLIYHSDKRFRTEVLTRQQFVSSLANNSSSKIFVMFIKVRLLPSSAQACQVWPAGTQGRLTILPEWVVRARGGREQRSSFIHICDIDKTELKNL